MDSLYNTRRGRSCFGLGGFRIGRRCRGGYDQKRKTELYPEADNYLLVGDATYLPVLNTILEDLPGSAKGICIVEGHEKEDEQEIQTDANVRFIWLHNTHPQ